MSGIEETEVNEQVPPELMEDLMGLFNTIKDAVEAAGDQIDEGHDEPIYLVMQNEGDETKDADLLKIGEAVTLALIQNFPDNPLYKKIQIVMDNDERLKEISESNPRENDSEEEFDDEPHITRGTD